MSQIAEHTTKNTRYAKYYIEQSSVTYLKMESRKRLVVGLFMHAAATLSYIVRGIKNVKTCFLSYSH